MTISSNSNLKVWEMKMSAEWSFERGWSSFSLGNNPYPLTTNPPPVSLELEISKFKLPLISWGRTCTLENLFQENNCSDIIFLPIFGPFEILTSKFASVIMVSAILIISLDVLSSCVARAMSSAKSWTFKGFNYFPFWRFWLTSAIDIIGIKIHSTTAMNMIALQLVFRIAW